TRTYSFPAQRAYFTRKLFVRNDSGSPIILKRVTDCALSFVEPFASADFHDDNMDQGDPGSEMFTETEKPSLYRTSINVFLRNPKGGLYAGLRYPYFKPDISERGLSLSYETNYRLNPGETLELPSTFIGAYRKTGYIYRKELHWAPRILATEQEELDLGEVLAMRQVLRDYLPKEPCPRDGYFTWLNSWWANAELRGKWGDKEADAYCDLAQKVKWTGSLDMISTAPVWCGWVGFIEPCPEIDAIGQEAVFPMNPQIEHAMSCVNDLRLPVSGFCEPNSLNRHYRKDRPDWKLQPTPDPENRLIQNCHANPDYEDWFYNLTVSCIEQCQLSGWAWDHVWLRRPMVCYDSSHGHEPGNCEFQQYRNVTNLIQRLRKRYPRLFIEIYWGLKEAGPWSLRGLNSLENAYENASPPPPGMTPADDLRFQHWFNHNYRFIPTYMNMAQMNFAKEGNGHLYSLLSCLSASTHASLCDWVQFDTPEQGREIFAPMRRWKDWATRNMQYLEDRIDLFGMPCREGGIDGTAHIVGDRGFIFVFNPTDKVRYGSITLTETIGIRKGSRFAIDEISTGSARRAGVRQKASRFTFEMAPKSAMLFELKPTTD
ncbi:hypothetical protein GX411_03225, partial [Candidatus Fermentibacteria bacterium]|nr:hypothetical protein [Candidatus Fermentibacteria bacterium]